MVIAVLQEGGDSWLVRATAPWAHLYSHSKAVSAAVLFLHLVPLLVAGGTALAADRATMRAARGAVEARRAQLAELAATHRLVVGGLALSFASGVLMFLSDVETFLGSPLFWVKLALVGLLLANGLVMTRTEATLAATSAATSAAAPARSADSGERLWSRLRTVAAVSGVLWLATTLVGVLLTQYS